MLRITFRWDEAQVDRVLYGMEYSAWGTILGLLLISLPAVKSISFNDHVWCEEV